MEKGKKKRFIAKSIFMTHVRRIGWIRTTLGGGLMYVSVFEFIFIHLTTIIVLYKCLLAPFSGLKRFKIRDYILLDRGKIEGMRLFDRFNCEFCGYANGTARIWNAEVDELATGDWGKGNILLRPIAAVYALCLLVFLLFNFVFSKILFFFIASFLGLHWTDTRAIGKRLKETDYAGAHGFPVRGVVRFAKLYAESLALNLEQIESGWCPLKHIETETTVVSDHHQNFYPREKLTEAIDALARDGSVSPKKPRY